MLYEKINCPLCFKAQSRKILYHEKLNRDFYQCECCALVFVPRDQLLKKDEEKTRYRFHENQIRSKGYEKFLRRLIEPIVSLHQNEDKGLDYGEGHYPMLREILKDEGFCDVDGYDLYFNPVNLENKKYNFITCSEAIEHFNNPGSEVERISKLLLKGGTFVISTGLLSDDIDLKSWHYITDPTHVNFFSLKTFEWLASSYKFEVIETKNDLVILKKE